MCEEKRRTPPRDALTSAEYYISYYLGLHIENYIEFEQISRRRHRLALFALMRCLERTALTPPLVGLLALPLSEDEVAALPCGWTQQLETNKTRDIGHFRRVSGKATFELFSRTLRNGNSVNFYNAHGHNTSHTTLNNL